MGYPRIHPHLACDLPDPGSDPPFIAANDFGAAMGEYGLANPFLGAPN
jgi:hypothetical protein